MNIQVKPGVGAGRLSEGPMEVLEESENYYIVFHGAVCVPKSHFEPVPDSQTEDLCPAP
jgi:hypothetical protein